MTTLGAPSQQRTEQQPSSSPPRQQFEALRCSGCYRDCSGVVAEVGCRQSPGAVRGRGTNPNRNEAMVAVQICSCVTCPQHVAAGCGFLLCLCAQSPTSRMVFSTLQKMQTSDIQQTSLYLTVSFREADTVESATPRATPEGP